MSSGHQDHALNAVRFFSLGFLKSSNKPETIPELKFRIQRVNGEIQPER